MFMLTHACRTAPLAWTAGGHLHAVIGSTCHLQTACHVQHFVVTHVQLRAPFDASADGILHPCCRLDREFARVIRSEDDG